MSAFLSRLDYFLPETTLNNDDLKKDFPDVDFSNTEKRVGIKSRHIAGENETALDLGFESAKKILTEDIKQEIDFVILCTQSPDYFLPTGACILQDKLGLRTEIGAFDFNLGCSGYVYGLAIAKSLIFGGVAQKILFIVAETYSKHIHPKDRANRAIFGDGAAATIIEQGADKIGQFVLGTDGSGYDKLIVPNGCKRKPFDPDAPQKSYGSDNITTNNHLHMNGPEIFNFTIEKVPETVNMILIKNNLALDEVDYFIFHQANKYMLNYLRKKIGIPKEKFYIDLETTGNNVSATIPIALKNAINRGIIKAGDKIMVVGFGVGLSWGGDYYRYLNTKIKHL